MSSQSQSQSHLSTSKNDKGDDSTELEPRGALSCSINVIDSAEAPTLEQVEPQMEQAGAPADCELAQGKERVVSSISAGLISDLADDSGSRSQSRLTRASDNLTRYTGGGDSYDDDYDDGDDECFRRNSLIKMEPGLVYLSRERLKLKDFSNEVRAAMDVEQFVHEAEIMLDMSEISVEDIVEAMLRKVRVRQVASVRRSLLVKLEVN